GEVFPPGSTVNITWNTGGAPASATYTLEYTANCGNRSLFDNVEHGVNGWTTSHLTTTLNWTQVTSDSFSPTHSWFAGDESKVNDQYLVSPQFTIGSGAQLSFAHRYDLEDDSPTSPTRGYDGGVVEISTNGGTSWTDLGAQMTQNGYNHTISSAFHSPL